MDRPTFVLMWLLVCSLFAIGVGLGCVLEHNYGQNSNDRDEVQAEAVKAGVAYYELNPTTGKIDFRYVDIHQVIRSVVGQLQNSKPNSAGVLQ